MDLEFLFFIPMILELIAALTATATFPKFRDSNERYFLYFLWYTLAVELTGAVIGYGFGANNYWLFNSFTITGFLFYFYWYYTILKRKSFRKTVIVFAFVFLVVAVISLITQTWLQYHSYTFITGAAFVLVLTLFHFFQLLNSDEVLIVKYKLSFWISTALLLFNMGMIPYMLLSEYADMDGLSYLIILLSLNLILYGCYIIGFLWTKKKYNLF